VQRKVLDRYPSAPVSVLVIWVPVNREQNWDELQANAHREQPRWLPDPRATNFTDSTRRAANAWSPVLGMAPRYGVQLPAWDVYLVFGPEARWGPPAAPPPTPAFWMHQLPSGAPANSSRFNGDQLRARIEAMLPK
jgi:hypothetical protein